MVRKYLLALTAASAALTTPAIAQRSLLRSTGTITAVTALQNGVVTSAPAGRIAVGDRYTLEATFDLGAAQLTSLFDADPTVNIYYLPGTIVNLTTPSFSRTFSPRFDFNSSVQLWNDRDVVGPVDSQSFSFFDYDVSSRLLPFDLGTGMQSMLLGVNAFDFTARARRTDLIGELVPFSRFGSRTFSLGQLNSATNLFVAVDGTADASLDAVPAVPEPATWGMMILGFGIIGAAMRRRSLNVSVHHA